MAGMGTSPLAARAADRRFMSAQKTEVTRQAVVDLRHVIPREIVHQLAGDVRDVNRADLIDQDLGIPARDDDLRPEDGRLGTGGGRDDGHRGPGILLDADDQPETPPSLLMATLDIAEVYRIDGAADHVRSAGLAGTVILVPVIRILPSAS